MLGLSLPACLPCLLCHTVANRKSSAILGHRLYAIEVAEAEKNPNPVGLSLRLNCCSELLRAVVVSVAVQLA